MDKENTFSEEEIEEARNQVDEAKEKWLESIKLHLTAIGNSTGFLIAAVGTYLAVSKEDTTCVEKIVVTLAVFSLFIQSFFWLMVIKRNRDIDWNYLSMLHGVITRNGKKAAEYSAETLKLHKGNEWREQTLNIIVYVSTALVLSLLVLRMWAIK